eukprot:NODE_3033_length_428_cov_346.042216_g2524_i0.p1 GENE.NODE_3033_length_428_cov_346.042216_g2524_i0~~NODE_3033_length_428_cov_346.042216_g2524_i0.p1  ORF type:complete len:102 (-),score=36.29 NODE_3033_length_428_cov_346.042216_g2524_i0:122-397(-)
MGAAATDDDAGKVQKDGARMRQKVLAMAKVARMFSTLRTENESIVALKGLAGGKLPIGILQQGPQAVTTALGTFADAKQLDMANEKRPGNI